MTASDASAARLSEAADQAVAAGQYARACILYERLLLSGPDREVRYRCGTAYLARGRYAEALEHYRAAEPEPQRSVQGRLAIARVHLAMKDLDAARAEITRPPAPATADALALMGDLAREDHDAAAADRYYRRATQLDPRCVNAWLGWSTLLAEGGDVERALDSVLRALETARTSPDVYARAAALLPQSTRRDEAMRQIDAVVARTTGPDGIQARRWWGNAVRELGDASAAFEQFLSAVALGAGLGPGKPPRVFEDIASTIDDSNRLARLALVASTLDAKGDVDGRLRWARVLAERGWREPAAAQVELALRQAPTDQEAFRVMGAALLDATEDERRAIVQRMRAVVVQGSSAQGHALLAGTLAQAELPAEAEAELTRATELAASDADRFAVHDTRASLLLDAGDEDAAADEWRRALRLAGPLTADQVVTLIEHRAAPKDLGGAADALARLVAGHAEAAVQLAWANRLQLLGRNDEAARFYARVNQLDPDHSLGWLGTAQVHINRKRWPAAFDAYASAAEAEPTDSWVYRAWLSGLEQYEAQEGVALRLSQQLRSGAAGLTLPVRWDSVREAQEATRTQFGRLVQTIERHLDRPQGRQYFDIGSQLAANASRFPEAERCLQHAVEHLPDDVEVQRFHGLLLLQLGARSSAVAAFAKAIALSPRDVDAHWNRARALAAAGQYQEACAAFEEAFQHGAALTVGPAGADGQQIRAAILADWALALTLRGEFDAGVAKARAAVTLRPDEPWTRFRLAHSLGAAGEYEAAREVYEQARALGMDLPYGDHNVANDYATQGRYRRARERWDTVRAGYEAGLDTALRVRRDADYCLYYGDTCREVFADFTTAEALLLAARALDPDKPMIHIALARMHLEARRTLEQQGVDVESRDNDLADRKIRHGSIASESYITALRLLSRPGSTPDLAPPDVTTLLALGEAHLLMDEAARAEDAFKAVLVRQPTSAQALLGLGNALIALKRHDEAARALRGALLHGRDDPAVRTTLARALLRGGALEEAEREFQSVLAKTRFYVDALVGLAELHLDMAARPAAERESAEREDRYRRAIQALASAIMVASSPDRPLGVRGPSAAAYYLSGYAKVRLWETRRLGRDRRLVQEALRDFRACCEIEPGHVKATQAIERVQEERAMARSWSERLVPTMIIVFAVGLFLMAQWGFLVGFPRQAERVALTARSFESLRQAGLDEATLKSLKPLEDVRFAGDEALLARASAVLDKQLAGVRPLLVAHAARSEPIVELARLDATAYSLLTFGALVFLVAGAYLPQLTSLKFPGLQLEKTSVDRLEVSYSVGISREKSG